MNIHGYRDILGQKAIIGALMIRRQIKFKLSGEQTRVQNFRPLTADDFFGRDLKDDSEQDGGEAFIG